MPEPRDKFRANERRRSLCYIKRVMNRVVKQHRLDPRGSATNPLSKSRRPGVKSGRRREIFAQQ